MHRRLPNPSVRSCSDHFTLGSWAQPHVNHRQEASHQKRELHVEAELHPTAVITVGDRSIDVEAAKATETRGLLLEEPYPNATMISRLTELLDRL